MPEFINAEEIRRRTVKILELSGLGDAGVAGTQTNLIIQALAERLGELSADNKNGFVNGYIQNATGFYLDFKGEELGLVRRGAAPALILASDKNLRFYTNRGSLRDRLGSQIPASTEVTNPSNSVVFVVNATEIPAGVSEVFVAASSLNLGPAGNIGRGSLTLHSLNVDDVFVTNELPISTGRNTESDGLYRRRLLQHVRGTIAITAEEIISQVTALPGVIGARFLPSAFGINHPAILMTGPDKLPQSTVSQAEAITQPFLPFGSRLVFLTPDYVDIDIRLAVRHNNVGNSVNLTSTIPVFVNNLIRDLSVGVAYDFTRLDAEITRRYPEVIDVEPIEIKINGKIHSNNRVKLREHEQLIVSSVIVELIN